MSVIVYGNSTKRVEIKDLDDCVYYKQQKVFTDAQYERSGDLQREIKSGRLVKLEHRNEGTGSYDPSSSFSLPQTQVSVPQPQVSASSEKKIDQLMERIDRLEESVRANPEVPAENRSIDVLSEKIERLERALSSKENTDMKGLDDIINRLERIVSGGGSMSAQEAVSSKGPDIPQEEPVYVPNLSIEDGNSNIKLDVRQIDRGDSLSDSLKKLKELRSKSK